MTLNSLDSFDEDATSAPPLPDPTRKSYILLTAPTAKAAKVLGNRAGYRGYTLHQVLKSLIGGEF